MNETEPFGFKICQYLTIFDWIFLIPGGRWDEWFPAGFRFRRTLQQRTQQETKNIQNETGNRNKRNQGNNRNRMIGDSGFNEG